MILVFDTFGGLCNQILDIQCAIHFCISNQFIFTFRFCSFRNNDNIKLFFDQPFGRLFNKKYFSTYSTYIDFEIIKKDINPNNTFNYKNKRAIEIFKNENEVINHLKHMKSKYIVLKQFFAINNFKNQLHKYYLKIKPNNNLFTIFNILKKKLLPPKYNYIHFRYETDFTDFFNTTNVHSIDSLLKRLKFKNNQLKIYIACSNIKKLSKTHLLINDLYSYKNILFKDDFIIQNNLDYLNFEELAFIDFLIGINSCEVFGHKKSSFSSLLNNFKHTNNYYNIY